MSAAGERKIDVEVGNGCGWWFALLGLLMVCVTAYEIAELIVEAR